MIKHASTVIYEPVNGIPEIALWRAVLLQALIDASGGGPAPDDNTIDSAKAFLFSPQCVRVCQYAAIDHGYFMRKLDLRTRRKLNRNFSRGKRV